MESDLRKASSVQFLAVEEPTFSVFRLQRCLSFAGKLRIALLYMCTVLTVWTI